MGHALLPACAAAPVAASSVAASATGSPVAPASVAADTTVSGIPGLWRGSDLAQASRFGIATGFASLDAELPGGGWPAGALIEVLHRHAGIGEMRLLFPALGSLARAGSPVFLLEPPWTPYAPAFADGGIPPSRLIVVRPRRPADALWACEQILKGLSDGALIAWPRHLRMQDARRLQLAVEGKPVLAVLMRPFATVTEATPAVLRIALEATPSLSNAATSPVEETRTRGHLTLRILKRRGGVLARPIVLTPPSPLFSRPLPPLADVFPTDVVDSDSPQAFEPRLHSASA